MNFTKQIQIILLLMLLQPNLLLCVNFQLQTALLEKSKKTNVNQNAYNQKSYVQPTQIKVVQIQRLFSLLQEIRDSSQVLAGVFSERIDENYKSCVKDIDEFNCTYSSHWEFLQTKHQENIFEISKDIQFKEKLINEMKDLMLLEGWKKQQTLKKLFQNIKEIEVDKSIVKEISNLLKTTFSSNLLRSEQIQQNEKMFIQLKSKLRSAKIADQISSHFTDLKSLYTQNIDSSQFDHTNIYPTGLNELDCEDPSEYLKRQKLSLKQELSEFNYFSFQQQSVKMIKNEDDQFSEFIEEDSLEKKEKKRDQDESIFIQTSESLDIEWLKVQVSEQTTILSQKIKKAFKLLQSNLHNEKMEKIEQIQTFKNDIKAAQEQHSLKIYDINNQITHLNWKIMEKTDILEDLHQKISDCKKQKEYLDTCQEIKNFDLAYLSSLDAVKSITMSAIDEIMEVLQKDPEVSDIKFQILESNQILLQSQITNLLQEFKFTNLNKKYRKQSAHEFLHTFGYQSSIENNNQTNEEKDNDYESSSNSQENQQLTKLAQNIIEKQKALSNNQAQDEDYIRNEKLLIQEEISNEIQEVPVEEKKIKNQEKNKSKEQKKQEQEIPIIELQEEIF